MRDDKIRIVWAETTNGQGPNRRYIAKAFGEGTGWGIWDRKKQNWIKSSALSKMTIEQLREEMLN